MINQKVENFYQKDSFSFYLGIALLAHVVAVIILILLQWLGGISIFENSKKNDTKMIQSSVRVDVVGMPKFTVQELKKMKVAPISNLEKGKADKAVEDNTKSELDFNKVSKKVNLSKLFKNLANKNKIKKQNSKVDTKDLIAKNKDLKSLVLEGNKISKGTSVVGDNLKEEKTLFNEYIASLPNSIRPYWKLPSYLLDQQLNCRIRVFIAANGKILKTQVYESSGVDEFDQRALKALRASDPLPIPDKNILAKVASGEVILGFPL